PSAGAPATPSKRQHDLVLARAREIDNSADNPAAPPELPGYGRAPTSGTGILGPLTLIGCSTDLSVVAEHGMGPVGPLEPRDLVRCEHELGGGQCVLEMSKLGRADDRRADAALVQEPGERDPSRRHAALGGDLGDAFDHVEVFWGAVELLGVGVGRSPSRLPLARPRARAGEPAAREWAPRDDPDSLVDALRNHLALLLPI